MLIYLANWPVKRIDAWDTLLKARSIEKMFSATENKEEVLQFEISLDDLKLKRRQMNFLQDRDNFSLL